MHSVMRVCLVMLAFSVILMSIAFETADAEKKEIDKILDDTFDFIDANKDGKISLYELKENYKKAGLNDKQIEEMFKQADANGDGEIDKAEFLKSFGDSEFPRGEKEDVLKSMFHAIDTDNSGYLDLQEVIKYFEKLGVNYTKEEAEEKFKKMNKSGNGKITFKEFEESDYQD